MAELDQLKAGLNVLGLGDEMERCPDSFESFFVTADIKLTAGQYIVML